MSYENIKNLLFFIYLYLFFYIYLAWNINVSISVIYPVIKVFSFLSIYFHMILQYEIMSDNYFI